MSNSYRLCNGFAILLLSLALGACGGGGGGASFDEAQFSIGGRVAGLASGQQVTLLNNGADALVVSTDGAFTFATPVAYNGSYNITVAAQPVGQTCSIATNSGSGAGVTTNVSNVSLVCSTNTYRIGGTVSGLASGQQVTLLNNGADALVVSTDGAFTFATPVAYNGSYNITVATQPVGQTCSIATNSGSGAGVTANVSNVSLVCSTNTYRIGGTVSGLATGKQVTLQNNGADALTVSANGAFTFATPVVFDGSYNITVNTQPVGQTCSIATNSGSGAGVTANVSNVSLVCSTNTYAIRGSVSGLGSGKQVTLQNNGADALTVSSNGNFAFVTPVAYGGSYGVTVGTQPLDQWCSVVNGSGPVAGGVINVSVQCKDSSGLVTTIAGMNTNNRLWGDMGYKNGQMSNATFYDPNGLVYDSKGNLYVTDSGNSVIRKISTDGIVSTFAGTEERRGNVDGPTGTGRFNYPSGITVDSNDNLYVTDENNHNIRKIDTNGVISTFAGSTTGVSGFNNGPKASATFYSPTHLRFDSKGNLFVTDRDNSLIRKIDTNGNVTTFAGIQSYTFGIPYDQAIDGAAGVARFLCLKGLVFDASDNMYIVDRGIGIRKIDPTGTTTTPYPSTRGFKNQSDIARDADGNMYVTGVSGYSNVVKISSEGNMYIIAGSINNDGYADGKGALARFRSTIGIVFDANGNLLVADSGNGLIRKIVLAVP